MKFLKKMDLVTTILTLFIMSIILGMIYKMNLETDLNAYINDFISKISTTRQNTFLTGLIISLIFVASISEIGLPIIIFYMFYEGFSMGFTIALFFENLGIKGLIFYLFFILIIKSIYILIVLYMSIMSVRYTYKTWHFIICKDAGSLSKELLNAFYRYFIVLSVTLLNSLIIYLWGNNIVYAFYKLLFT